MTPSEKQIQAARANGAKSRGPKTAQGKLASSRNATTHGLTARTVILSTESGAQFEADLRAYLDHFRPQTKPETDLVHQLAAANWRLARYAAIETALFEHKMDDQADWLDQKYETLPDHYRLAIAFESLSEPSGSLALLNRYQARLQRQYERLLKALTDLQAARLAAESKLSPKQKLPNEPKRILQPFAADRLTPPDQAALRAPDPPAPPLVVPTLPHGPSDPPPSIASAP